MARDSEKEADVVCEQVDKKEERVNASNDENEIEDNVNENDDVEESNPDEADNRKYVRMRRRKPRKV